ncbi:MAG: SPOR domain-containing protein [Gammaproteobacteria bacterium]|nr:SPOR domain-containing protein [Gammaproteobacteria bacterium]
MASHDYAKRKKKPRKPAVSRWVMLLTIAISMAFVAGLIVLSQQPDDSKVSTVITKKANPTKAAPKKQNQGVKNNSKTEQKNGFDFYTLLPDSEVTPGQVEEYASTPKDPNKKTNTLLQAGSFRKLADANRLRAKLILINMDNVVAEKTVSSSGSVWYRVRIGPFSNRSTLNKAEDILAQQGIESIRINKSAN